MEAKRNRPGLASEAAPKVIAATETSIALNTGKRADLVRCFEASCPGRRRRGALCPLCGTGEAPDATSNHLMRSRPFRGPDGDRDDGAMRQKRKHGRRNNYRQLCINGRWMTVTDAMRLVDTTTELGSGH